MLRSLPVFAVLAFSIAAHAEIDVSSYYEVSTQGTTARLKAGDSGKVVISIKVKNGAHVSDEAPLKIELSSRESKLARETLTLADSVNKKQAGASEYPDPRFEVDFTPHTQGPTTVEAKMTFFLCMEKVCARQTKKLSLPVEVM